MDFSHYNSQPVDVAVKLTNSVDIVTGEDDLQTPRDVADFVRAELDEWVRIDGDLTESDLRSARTLRTRLRSVWEAGNAGEAAAELNRILDAVGARPRISVHGGANPHLHFEPRASDPIKTLGAVTAMALSVALIEGGWERFGRCSSPRCNDVFVDTSKNRSRRHCSETCTTRESVAAYRARQKTKD